MENKPSLQKSPLQVDSLELLIRFLIKCKQDAENDELRAKFISSCADIVAAVYYYRKFPNVNEFIEKYLNHKDAYLQLQWTRTTWASLSKMSDAEISDLVINQVQIVDNLEED